MKKQLIAAIAAVVLAALGVLLLVSYAQGANDRAFAGVKMVKVLRVQTDVPSGTPTERVAGSVKLVEIPAVAKVDGALTSLDLVKGKTTNAPLVAGEQVLAARFGGAASTKAVSSVPKGLQEVSIAVATPRVAGGKIKPGDHVGIIASYTGKAGGGGDTNFALERVLVTRVADATITGSGDVATGAYLVTFAVNAVDAEKIVNVSEFGKLWLTLQNDDARTGGGRRLSGEDVLS